MTCSILVPTAQSDRIVRRFLRLTKACGIEFFRVEGQTTLPVLEWRRFLQENGQYFSRQIQVGATVCDRFTVGDLPTVQGWKFVARIEHTNAGNLILPAHDERGTDLSEYREVNSYCEHCSTARRRIATYLVRSPDGSQLLKIGRNCLRDFLNADPAAFIKAEKLAELLDDPDSLGWGGGGAVWDIATEWFVACAQSSIDHDGWARSCEDLSTSGQAAMLARPCCSKNERIIAAWHKRQPTEATLERAREAIAWAQGHTIEAGDYLWNLRVAALGAVVGRRTEGILASLPMAYSRHLEQEVQRKNERAALPESRHLGAPKSKIEVDVELVRVRYVDGAYGGKTVCAFRTSDGADVVWFASGKAPKSDDVGTRYHMRATVKGVGEYQGRAQTTVIRAKLEAIGS